MYFLTLMLKYIVTISLVFFSSNVLFAADEASDWQFLFQLDNDLFLGSDRGYTNGIRFGFVQEIPFASPEGQHMNKRLRERSSKLQGRLQSLRIDDDADLRFARGFGLTQLIFTPEDSQALSAPAGERPYAGWLGLEYSLHVKEENFVNSLTFSVGTTGENSLAQPSQNWVHENISDSDLFQGWDSQVPSEATVNINFDHKQRFRGPLKFQKGPIEIDGYYEGGLALGNFRTDTYLGGLARIGYRLPANFSTPRVQLGSYGHELFSDKQDYGKKLSAFAFAGLRATAVLHDITLDGPLFRHFDTGVKSKSLIRELLYGFGIRYKNIDLVMSRTLRSDEFVGQQENQEFGSFMLRFKSNLF